MEDFIQHEKPETKPEEEDGDLLELVPRLTTSVVLVDWGFTLYGTGEHDHDEQSEEDHTEDNPAINPHLAGLFVCLSVCLCGVVLWP